MCAIPDNLEEMAAFAEKLADFGVSLEQYKCSLLMDDRRESNLHALCLSLPHDHLVFLSP